ncbi:MULTISPECIES: serine kinase [unclassified Pantoea]|uniref:serine kinase n=1 Tax=unclassified Pantoea TaxID=2630326 RepID=UPI001231F2F7|nr:MULTISPECIES: serine kinase [unclassified Pantoea]KAA5969530.1 serine kinase [Pantoea sp. M_6]KAA5975749.1 serine kinase [Pantoea sp. M_8]KAA5993966.1 serine kinase [Pantoea sp. M_10]KAA5998954.1 serine kinase [Pantoea sp. M_5]
MMHNAAPDEELALRWLRWWHTECWLQADESWCLPPLARLSVPVQRQFLRQHASCWQHTLGISGELAAPEPMVLAISDLPPQQRAQLLILVAEICGGAMPLSAELKIWLRRLAKGMRVACWLPAGLFTTGGSADSLCLLQALFPTIWPRLRLLFPAEEAPVSPALSLPDHRLRPLWEVALWQVQHPSGAMRNVET